jgi:hypothetical protein
MEYSALRTRREETGIAIKMKKQKQADNQCQRAGNHFWSAHQILLSFSSGFSERAYHFKKAARNSAHLQVQVCMLKFF